MWCVCARANKCSATTFDDLFRGVPCRVVNVSICSNSTCTIQVANTSPANTATHTTTIMDALMHATPSQNSSTILIQPPKFNGYTDVKSRLDAMEVVFLAKHVSSDQEKMIWARSALLPGIVVEFFESIQGIPSWENSKFI